MSEMTCRCGRPTKDAAYTCDDCLDGLAKALGDVPWLADELEITTSRQVGIDYRRLGGSTGGKKPAEMPLPGNMSAANAGSHLRGILVSWVLLCAEEGVRHQSSTSELPADNLAALSRWMLWRVDGLAFHEAGSDAVEEIESAVAHCHRLIDRPADRQYLGRCEGCTEGRLYGRPASEHAVCDSCDARLDAEAIRKRLLEELDDRLCTAAEIARLSTYLGLKANREQVRNRINQWAKRKLIQAEAAFDDAPVYRFGAVYARLAADEYRRSSAS